jgi:hypothetical protein
MKAKVKIWILRALHQMDGVPLPQAALMQTIFNAYPGALQSDADAAIRELQSHALIHPSHDAITETVTWTLTDAGKHKASQL